MRTEDDTQVRPMLRADLPALRAVIDGTGLFPGALLDGMAAPFLDGKDAAEVWLVAGGAAPAALAYAAPERMTQGTWNLLLIAVRPDRQGLGAALVRAVEASVAARGARLLLVETSGLPAFETVRAFHRRRGFEAEARIRGFYAEGDDKLVFRKAIAAAPGR